MREKKLAEKESKMKENTDNLQRQSDSVLLDERNKLERMTAKYQEDHDKLRDELCGELTRLRAEDGVPMSIHLAEIVSHAETAAVLDTCHVGRVRLGHATCIAPSLGGR